MSKRKHFVTIGKVMGVYGFLLTVLFIWEAGFDAAHHHYFQTALDLIISLFGFGFMAVLHNEYMDDKLDKWAEMVATKETQAALDKLFKEHHDEMVEAMMPHFAKDFPQHAEPARKANIETLKKYRGRTVKVTHNDTGAKVIRVSLQKPTKKK